MRVQPHLPRSPLLATVTLRSGLALSACSAANNPAPPDPRMRISVLILSTVMSFSEHTDQKGEGDERGERRRQAGQPPLAVAPVEILEHQHAQSPARI